MNKFDVIDYLNRFKLLNMQIERRHREILKWQDISLRISPGYSLAPIGSGVSDRTQMALCNIAEEQENLLNEIEELLQIRQDISDMVALMPNDTQRVLLECRYIDGKTFDEIAELMSYSLRWVMKLHEKAVSFLAENLEYEEEDNVQEHNAQEANV